MLFIWGVLSNTCCAVAFIVKFDEAITEKGVIEEVIAKDGQACPLNGILSCPRKLAGDLLCTRWWSAF